MSPLPDEVTLQILPYLTDDGLLRLASVSRHIHDLALLLHLQRNHVSLSDVESYSIPQQARSAAACSLLLARFVTRLDTLSLNFYDPATIRRDVECFQRLVEKLKLLGTFIPSIYLNYSYTLQWPREVILEINFPRVLACLMRRTQAVAVLAPLHTAILRPASPKAATRTKGSVIRRLLRRNTKPFLGGSISESTMECGFNVLRRMTAGGDIPQMHIRTLPADSAVGTVVFLRAPWLRRLGLPRHLGLSGEELSAILDSLRSPLPLFKIFRADVANPTPNSICYFFERYPSVETVDIRTVHTPGYRPPRHRALPGVEGATLTALPHLQHLVAPPHIACCILNAQLPKLQTLALQLLDPWQLGDAYTRTMATLCTHGSCATLVLYLSDPAAYPWKAPRTRSEPRHPSHTSTLRLVFTGIYALTPRGKDLEALLEWLGGWSGLKEFVLVVNAPSSLVWMHTAEIVRSKMPGVFVLVQGPATDEEGWMDQ
ncbi:F-box domain-containing protein [Mycena kentingensis (nom. inval.)]|nr:F-box domain-containing protein [Mycena kentingensis (nom. inval.)]